MIFENLPAITEYLAWAVKDAVEGADAGFSNQSCSAYVRTYCYDEGEGREVRFSDHGDRHATSLSDRLCIDVSARADEIEDEDGDFAGFEVADWWLTETIEAAATHLKG